MYVADWDPEFEMTTLRALVESVSEDKRDRVAALLADNLVAGARSLNGNELGLLNSILEKNIKNLNQQTKQDISQTLAASNVTSTRLAMRLASEDATIAAPLLEHSPVLRSQDLLTLAREQGQEHLMAISQRDLLDSELASTLLSLGDAEVRKSVVSNIGADISPEEFEKQISEIPHKLRKRISDLRKSYERLMEDLLTEDNELVAGPALEDREANIPVKEWINALQSGRVTLDKALARLCMEKNLSATVTLLSEVSGFPLEHLKHMMVRFDATGLAVVCKCLGVGSLEYSTVSRLRCAHLRLPSKISGSWSANYNVLTETDARRFLKLIKHKLNNPEPVQPPTKEASTFGQVKR